MKGVSDQFLKILDLERRRAWRALALGLAIAAIAFYLAELADEPWLGGNVRAYWLLLVLGAGVGLVWARWHAHRVQESLRGGWNAWMRMSVSCTRIDEIYHKVRDRDPPSPARTALLSSALLTANLVLFIALWMEAAFATSFAYLMVATNGLVVGVFLARAWFHLRWVRAFTRAMDEVVQSHAVGVWGDR